MRGVRGYGAVHTGSDPVHPVERLQFCRRIATRSPDMSRGHHQVQRLPPLLDARGSQAAAGPLLRRLMSPRRERSRFKARALVGGGAWAALLSFAFAACGGQTEQISTTDGAPPGCTKNPVVLPFGSSAAIAAARCAVQAKPSEAYVIAVNTGIAGHLEPDGTSARWFVVLWNPTDHTRRDVVIDQTGATVKATVTQACGDAGSIDPANSMEIVPDAWGRYNMAAPQSKAPKRYFSLERECGTAYGPPAFNGVWIGEATSNGERTVYLFHYDWQGHFIDRCGPCVKPEDGLICNTACGGT